MFLNYHWCTENIEATMFLQEIIVFLLLLSSNQVSCKSWLRDSDVLDEILRNYDSRVSPNGPGDGPVRVAVNLLIRSISKVDDANMVRAVKMPFTAFS